jgi:group I intron endonuclease
MVIYETINLINNKRYIGQDSNDNPNYLGSGHLLKKAIEKYGRENFVKIVLERCETKEQLDQREKYWIDITNAQTSSNYYNIVQGGSGGNTWIGRENSKKHTQFKAKMKRINNDPQYIRTRNGHTEQTKENQRKAAVDRYTQKWFQNKYGTELGEIKFKERSNMLSKQNSGANNGAYKHIDRDEFRKDVLSGLDKPTIQKKHNLGSTAFTNKMLDVFNTSKIREARKLYNSTLVQP